MYKVYIHKLLKDLCTSGIGILLLNYNLSGLTFADDMTFSALYPSGLNALISIAYQYFCDWRYEFNYDKTAVVTFGESHACHSKAAKQRNWHVGPTHIDERDEYTNLGVYKNYCGSFTKNIDESIPRLGKRLVCYLLLILIEDGLILIESYGLYEILETVLYTDSLVWIWIMDFNSQSFEQTWSLSKMVF